MTNTLLKETKEKEKPKSIISLNTSLPTDLTIEELDRRLKVADLESQSASWANCGCDCDHTCTGDTW